MSEHRVERECVLVCMSSGIASLEHPPCGTAVHDAETGNNVTTSIYIPGAVLQVLENASESVRKKRAAQASQSKVQINATCDSIDVSVRTALKAGMARR